MGYNYVGYEWLKSSVKKNYAKTSREATSEPFRKMYSYLAEQEKLHETTLRKRLDELQQEIVDTKIKLEFVRMKLKGERGGLVLFMHRGDHHV